MAKPLPVLASALNDLLGCTVFLCKVDVKPEFNTKRAELKHLAWIKRWAALTGGFPVDTDVDQMPFSLEFGECRDLAFKLMEEPVNMATCVATLNVPAGLQEPTTVLEWMLGPWARQLTADLSATRLHAQPRCDSRWLKGLAHNAQPYRCGNACGVLIVV